MNTYRVFILHTTSNDSAATVAVAYVQGLKYGPAWQSARALLNDGKPHKDIPSVKQLFKDPELKEPSDYGSKIHGDHVTVAKIVDMKQKNVKLDRDKLAAILADDKATPEQKLEAMQAQLALSGAKAPAKA